MKLPREFARDLRYGVHPVIRTDNETRDQHSIHYGDAHTRMRGLTDGH